MEDKLNNQINKVKEGITINIGFLKAWIDNLEIQISNNDIGGINYYAKTIKEYVDDTNSKALLLETLYKLK